MSVPLCKFFSSNQTCKFGKHCRFSHSSQPPPPFQDFENCSNDEELLNASHLPDKPITKPAADSYPKDLDENGKSVNTETREPRAHREKVICSYYTNGYCRYGKSCRFSHDLRKGSKLTYNATINKRQRSTRENLPPRFQNKPYQHDDSVKAISIVAGAENSEQLLTSRNGQQVKSPSQNTPEATDEESLHAKTTDDESLHAKGPYKRKECPFYKSGRCYRGQRCRFWHPSDSFANASAVDGNLTVTVPSSSHDAARSHRQTADLGILRSRAYQSYPQNRAVRPLATRLIFTYQELEEVGSAKLRENEVNYIKKRFPKDKITIEEEGDSFTALINFEPSDPDWPFDIKVFPLSVTLPSDYPKKLPLVAVVADQDVPETVRRYLEVSILEWLEQKKTQLEGTGKVEMIFRAFQRWLDRSLEDIITEALKQLKRELIAKAAGLEFIPAQKLQAKFKTKSESSEEILDDGGAGNSEDGEDEDSAEDESSSEDDSSTDENDGKDERNTQSLDLDPQKKGTEIALKHLQLKENASALTFERLKLVIQCERCKNRADLVAFPGKVLFLQCEKCNHNQFVNFRPALVHQFSSILGYLDVDGCQAIDLILQDSQAVVSCMSCSKQTSLSGLVSGHLVDGWCKACNARFKVAIESVKFSQLVPSGIDTTVSKVVNVPSTKKNRLPKDPRIREGFPLPEFGTCKHYKQSYRWLRFPCCGKAYPCDVCHDKHEDHEMQLANRMICGHCCKEQNFSASRPCQSCYQHLTKIRSAHWEGGSGCRDKIAMSKSDAQKYSSMNKTVSNHKKKVQAGSKGSSKKKTKLRHS